MAVLYRLCDSGCVFAVVPVLYAYDVQQERSHADISVVRSWFYQ